TIRSPQVSSALVERASLTAEPSEMAVTGNAQRPTIVAMAAMMIVPINTAVITPMVLPSLLLSSILAMEDDMAKNRRGMTETKSKFKKISPTGFRISTA